MFYWNFFFLQSIVSPVFGSNGPLWSLSYEFWYYIIFPALILASAAWAGILKRILYAGLVLFLLLFVGPQIRLYFLIWLTGVLVGRLQQITKFRSPLPLLPLFARLIFAGALAWSRTHQYPSDLMTDYIVGSCFALWLYTLLLGSREDVSPAYAYGAKKLAGFSYTLYLTHFPALLLLRALLNSQGNWQPDPRHLAYALGIGLLMLIYAYRVAELTEAHTATVRRSVLHTMAPIQT